MDKKTKFVIAALLGCCMLLAFFSGERPADIDWSPTFELNKKKPFDLYIFDNEIDGLFKEKPLRSYETPYEKYSRERFSQKTTNILYIPPPHESIDAPSIDLLLEKAAGGACVLISATKFPEILTDTLQFKILPYSAETITDENDKFAAEKIQRKCIFSEFDTKTTKIISEFKTDSLRVECIEVKFGLGKIYLQSNPFHFTNRNLLSQKNSRLEVAHLMSLLNDKPLMWFVEKNVNFERSGSPLRFVFENRALKTAWTFMWISLIVFMIFRSRRIQRIIPEIEPNHNTTIDFVKTIGNLYYNQANHKDLIQKKLIYFLDRIKMDYGITSDVIDATFERKLRVKSGKSEQEIHDLVALILRLSKHEQINPKADLLKLNAALEKFFNKKIH